MWRMPSRLELAAVAPSAPVRVDVSAPRYHVPLVANLGSVLLGAALGGAVILGACGNDDPARSDAPELVRGCPVYPDPVAEPSTDAYDGFPSEFFATYCTRCHATALAAGEERSFAPVGLNWDDEGSVRANLARIRRMVGEVNQMPPTEPSPSCDERLRLITWIDDGAP